MDHHKETQNPNRKCKNYHMTYKGHYDISIPVEYEHLAFCYEGPETTDVNTDHTHVVLVTSEPISKKIMLQLMQKQIDNKQYPCNIRIDVHSQWQTMFHYHIGLGKKELCPNFRWITPPPYSTVTEYLTNYKAHRPTLNKSNLILQLGISQCVDKGIIPLFQANAYSKSILVYQEDKKQQQQQLSSLENSSSSVIVAPPPKKRHYWIYGPSNTGKTTWAEKEARRQTGIDYNDDKAFYNVPRNNDWKYYSGQKHIILNEYKHDFIDISTLQDMTDAKNYTLNYKGGSHRLAYGAIFYITTRKSPADTFLGNHVHDVDGIINRFHLKHMTKIFESLSSTILPKKKRRKLNNYNNDNPMDIENEEEQEENYEQIEYRHKLNPGSLIVPPSFMALFK